MSTQYEWYEDKNTISIIIPTPTTGLSKIDIYVSDLVLKINIPSIRYIKVLDLKHEIDHNSA